MVRITFLHNRGIHFYFGLLEENDSSDISI